MPPRRITFVMHHRSGLQPDDTLQRNIGSDQKTRQLSHICAPLIRRLRSANYPAPGPLSRSGATDGTPVADDLADWH